VLVFQHRHGIYQKNQKLMGPARNRVICSFAA